MNGLRYVYVYVIRSSIRSFVIKSVKSVLLVFYFFFDTEHVARLT